MARRGCLGLALGLLLAVTATAARSQNPPAPATPEGPVYVITFFEVEGQAAGKTARLLRQFGGETRRENGNSGFLALREISRPGRFATLDVWRDTAAADAHAGAASALADKLKGLLVAPFDIRRNAGLSVVGPAIGGEPNGDNAAVYVLTHVDVFPAGKDQTIDMLKTLAEASRKEPGNLRFDLLQQHGRLNHLPIVKAWRNAGAHAAHLSADHTRAFRAKLVPLQGALYDERLYQAVR